LADQREFVSPDGHLRAELDTSAHPRARMGSQILGLCARLLAAFSWWATCGGALTALAACSVQSPRSQHEQQPATESPRRGGTLIVSVRAEPRSFSWYTQHDGTTQLVGLLTQARLVRINPATQETEPWLASGWSRSDAGLRYTIKLRSGVTFADGTPFTSADVVFSVAAAYDKASALADSLMIGGKPIEATAIDPETVVITLPGPFGPGLRILDNLPILPRHKLARALSDGTFGSAWGVSTPPADVIGLGPFVLREYRQGERLVFARNDRYFRKDAAGTPLPYLEGIVVEVVPEQDAQILRLQAGQSDMSATEIRPEDYAPVKRASEDGRLQLLDLGASTDSPALWINLKPGAFARDPRRPWIQRDELRQAISLAVDRQRFVDTVYLGAAAPAFGPVTASNKQWFAEDSAIAHDVPRARGLLGAIGLEDRNHDGLLDDSSGATARITLLTQKGQTALERGAAVVRDELNKIGLSIDVVAMDAGALVKTFLSGAPYDAVYFLLAASDTDPAMNMDFWLSSGGAHIWNPGQRTPATPWEQDIDRLIARQASAADPRERRQLFVEAQKIFAAHQPMVYFAAPRVFVAASRRVINLTPAMSRPQLLWSADTIAIRQ
jgi:peptide/nickel transport system substrate-binding protein